MQSINIIKRVMDNLWLMACSHVLSSGCGKCIYMMQTVYRDLNWDIDIEYQHYQKAG